MYSLGIRLFFFLKSSKRAEVEHFFIIVHMVVDPFPETQRSKNDVITMEFW
jgi:hypothetical protein